MKVRQTATGIELRSTPGCMWGLGLWFVAGGTLCLAMIALLPGDLTLRDRLIGALIGAGVLGGGLYSLATAPATRLTLNMVDRTLRYVRKAPLRRRTVVDASFEEIASIDVGTSRDSEGDLWRDLSLLLGGREPLPLGSWPDSARSELLATDRAIRSALRGSRTSIARSAHDVTLDRGGPPGE